MKCNELVIFETMKLEDQVCSLVLAKRLKELGVKQESLFWHIRTWGECSNGEPDVSSAPAQYEVSQDKKYFHELWEDGCYSAFTVAELGEMLPVAISLQGDEVYLQHWLNGDRSLWSTAYKTFEHRSTIAHEFADTEADARAKMLIYLIENGLLVHKPLTETSSGMR